MNSVQLVGRVGAEPQFYGEGDHRMARVSLATTTRGFTKKDGTKVPDVTEWHNLVFGGGICSIIEKYVKTGELIAVKGHIHYDKWEDANKVVRYSTEIRVNEMELLGSKKESSEPVQQYKSEEEVPF